MTAQPGWYPAGVPGRERWWDGTQWTAHERNAAAAHAATTQHAMTVGADQGRVVGPAMGWYVYPPSEQPRWWNGVEWTAYRLKNGRPGADPYATEPPSMGWVLGGLFILIALMNLARVARDTSALVLVLVFATVGVLWVYGASRDLARRKVPAPVTAPIVEDSLRPSPGEAEAEGAGWYPVTGQVVRWWTGVRWAHYVAEKGRVRPTHHGPRGYRASMIVAAVFGALGLLGLALGIAISAASDPFDGVALIVLGALLLLIAGVLWLSIHLRRYAILLPRESPPIR